MLIPSLSSSVVWVIVVALTTLGTGTAIRLVTLRGRTDDYAVGRRNSLKTWWCFLLILLGLVVFGRTAAVIVFGLISYFGFREFSRIRREAGLTAATSDVNASLINDAQTSYRLLVACIASLIPLHYLLLWLDQTRWTAVFLPIGGLMLGSMVLVLRGQAKEFTSALGQTYLGLIVTTYFLSHAVMLFVPPDQDPSQLNGSVWFLFVVVVTEIDDITQSLVGRRIGKHKLSPTISPNKTWEGFLGGLLVSIVLSMLLGHRMLGVPWFTAAGYGVMIAVAALFGDLNISALKRDAGVKDSGTWLPGHGGLLDRVDSLTFTAPVAYYGCLVPWSG